MSLHSPLPGAAPGAPSSPTARAAEVRERIAKYDDWASHLERAHHDYVRRLPRYRRAFCGLTAAGFGCFALGLFPGIWGALCATVVSVGGYAMVKTRVWELANEIVDTRRELQRLRAGGV